MSEKKKNTKTEEIKNVKSTDISKGKEQFTFVLMGLLSNKENTLLVVDILLYAKELFK